ncbi:MAG: hypothetical protein J7559_21435, partial [Cohnella sp.]|nr:hypothetical protein [Cohnella sp.]
MKWIEGNVSFESPPIWAILERELFVRMAEAVDVLIEKYVKSDGTLLWPTNETHSDIDGLDDTYESFHNWPLLYLLGGDDKFLRYSNRQFEAITKQFASYDCGHGHPIVVNEYEQGYDWFHQGEGYEFFYLLCAADPLNTVHRERAVKYAGLYLNEDPEAMNYDADLAIITCPHTGSKGPASRNFDGGPWKYEWWKAYYGLPFIDIPDCLHINDMKDQSKSQWMGQVIQERWSHGDTPVNLAATSIVTNAFLFTGDCKYKQWILRYVEAWGDRIQRNGGIIPDNIGLDGEIGTYFGGKWYGGYYGWTWPHGFGAFGSALVIAGQNASIITGDLDYMNLP